MKEIAMTMLDQNDDKAQYRKIAVTIARTPDGGGNAGGGKYQVTYSPDPITVKRHNAVLAYALTNTPEGIAFTGMSSDDKTGQFSTATISSDGSLMVFIDTNSGVEIIDVTLTWSDNGVSFSHDPQVKNQGDISLELTMQTLLAPQSKTAEEPVPAPPSVMLDPQVKNQGDV